MNFSLEQTQYKLIAFSLDLKGGTSLASQVLVSGPYATVSSVQSWGLQIWVSSEEPPVLSP